MDPSPGPWTFAEHMYGIAHCQIDRDGRVIGCNLPIGNGPMLEQAPAMAQILRELVAGVPAEPWCAHPHSPVPKAQATAIGGAHLLHCEGLLAKCQVAPDERGDIRALE
jgi:hypothetical protein